MTKLNVEIPHSWSEPEPEREERIATILRGAATEAAMADAWYDHLAQHLRFPFWAYMAEPPSSQNTVRYGRTKLLRLAGRDRCAYGQIWVVGAPSMTPDTLGYFFLADLYKLEADLTVIQTVLDYLYWRERLS